MSMVYEEITEELAAWIGQQHMFFVATAPLAAAGHVNCSPKGLDALRVLGPRTNAYLDVTGSGAETGAHLRENGRIVFMFCEMTGLTFRRDRLSLGKEETQQHWIETFHRNPEG